MKAIVAGSSGLVGAEVVKLLLEDADFSEVVVYSRRPYPIEHPKLRVVLGELAELSLHSDELKGDIYFCCLGTTIKTAGTQENFRKVDFHGVVSFGRFAFTHHARKFVVVSASGAHPQSKIFYNRVKGETEKTLKDLRLQSLVIFRPGLLVGEREEIRTGEKMAINAFKFLKHVMPEKTSRSLGTYVRTLARNMAEEAKAPSPGLKIIEARDIK